MKQELKILDLWKLLHENNDNTVFHNPFSLILPYFNAIPFDTD